IDDHGSTAAKIDIGRLRTTVVERGVGAGQLQPGVVIQLDDRMTPVVIAIRKNAGNSRLARCENNTRARSDMHPALSIYRGAACGQHAHLVLGSHCRGRERRMYRGGKRIDLDQSSADMVLAEREIESRPVMA